MSNLKVNEPVYPVDNYKLLSETDQFNLAYTEQKRKTLIQKSKRNDKIK